MSVDTESLVFQTENWMRVSNIYNSFQVHRGIYLRQASSHEGLDCPQLLNCCEIKSMICSVRRMLVRARVRKQYNAFLCLLPDQSALLSDHLSCQESILEYRSGYSFNGVIQIIEMQKKAWAIKAINS